MNCIEVIRAKTSISIMMALKMNSLSSSRLLPCPFCGCEVILAASDGCFDLDDDEVFCDNCHVHTFRDMWNRRTPPALSARPNEAGIETLQIMVPDPSKPDVVHIYKKKNRFHNVVAGYRCGSTEEAADLFEKLSPKNEADAPRGQAVAQGSGYVQVGWYNYKTKTFIRLAEWASTERNHELLASGEVIRVYAYFPPPPSPVGEADGVREKYRAVTLEDARRARFTYIATDAEHLTDDECFLEALQSIGAVVPQEGK